MKKPKQLNRIFAAAAATLAGLTLAASSATAQYQVGQQGRALDASNRIGAGGFNTPVWQQPNVTFGNYNNNLITGNVTGGSQFRGNVPYTAPDVLRIPTAGGISDSFIRQSSGAPYGGTAQNNAQVSRSYIGASQVAAPPPGYVMQGSNGGYVPAQFKSVSPSDLRMDAAMTGSAPAASLPRPGQLLLPGPVDANTQTTSVITASPLYGVRAWNPNAASDQAFLNNNMGSKSALNKIDPITLEKMRDELVQPDTTDPAQLQQQMLDQQKINKQSGMLDTAVPTPFDAPQGQALSGSSQLKTNQPLGSSLITSNDTLQTGASTRMKLMSPQQQSTQYAELQKRLQQNRTAQAVAAADAQNDAARSKANAAAQAVAPGGVRGAQPAGQTPLTTPTGTRANSGQLVLPPTTPAGGIGATPVIPSPGGPTASGAGQIPPPAPINVPVPPPGGAITRPEPLKIESLASGVKAKGLADLLTEAETQMKAGKYNSALEEYDLAEQLAPNNPLINLGRANAELGQSYYGRAELHLRQAFMQDQALLMGRINLGSWLGNDRLTALVQDLRGIADREQKEARPVFLLSYIYYSIGNEVMASAYLDLADKRSGGKDELYATIRKNWQLSPAAPADQNK